MVVISQPLNINIMATIDTTTRSLTPENPVNSTNTSAGFDALKTYVGANPLDKQELSIMDRYAQRRQLATDASAANDALISSKYGGLIKDSKENTAGDITTSQESNRGFGVNMGALREFVKVGDRRVRDLTQARDELLLQNKANEASRLDTLLVDEQNNLTTARTTFLDNLLKMGQEARAVSEESRAVSAEGRALSAESRAERGFETPEQRRSAELANTTKQSIIALGQSAPDAGILETDDYNTAVRKYKDSHTYRTNQAQADLKLKEIEANIRQSNAAAGASEASTAKSLAETRALTAPDTTAQDTLTEKVGLINSLVNHAGLNSRVGPNSFSRNKFALADRFGTGQDFAAGVQQLVNKETIDTLVNLKARGGTLGALSDQERILLQTAATKIGGWEIKENGFGTGQWNIDETSFKKELETIKRLANKALVKAGGTPATLGQDDVAQVDAIYGKKSLTGASGSFSPGSYYK